VTKKVRSGVLQRAISLLRNVMHRDQDERELAEELDAHLSLAIEEKVRSGMKPEEAERAAHIELGGVEQVKELVRDARAGAWLDTLVRDCRFALRMSRFCETSKLAQAEAGGTVSFPPKVRNKATTRSAASGA